MVWKLHCLSRWRNGIGESVCYWLEKGNSMDTWRRRTHNAWRWRTTLIKSERCYWMTAASLHRKSVTVKVNNNIEQWPNHLLLLTMLHLRPHTHGCLYDGIYCSQGNRGQPAHYLKQHKNAGKRFRVYGALVLKAVFQWCVFFCVRIRTECSEHVNSFIDAYWAHVRKKNASLENSL